jgi:hypothetical protein
MRVQLKASSFQQPDNRISCILAVALYANVLPLVVQSILMQVSINEAAALVAAFDAHVS